jgi:hypothetical protein
VSTSEWVCANRTTRRIPKEGQLYAQHGLQVNIYRWLVLPHYPIDHLEVVYMDMSGVRQARMEVMNPRKLLGWLVPRVRKLKAALEGGRLPARVRSDGLWQCQGYCSFSERCWPKGVPTPAELKRKEETARDAVLRAVRRKRSAEAAAVA